MKKRKLELFLIIFHMVAGFSLILYPTVSNILKNMAFQKSINRYTEYVSQLDEHTYNEIEQSAKDYNKWLAEQGAPYIKFTDEERAKYESVLNIDGSGIIGYVVIEKINVSLPIYHGCSDEVLQSGIGHLETSSLPTGEKGTHCVICGHRGLPSATLFTNVDRLVIGDTFSLRVLNETFTYRIDQIKTVEPTDWSELQIEDNREYCTLLTCTPYAVNTHRLLLRGRRVPVPVDELQTEVKWYQVVADQYWKLILIRAVIVVAALAAVTVIVFVIIKLVKSKK